MPVTPCAQLTPGERADRRPLTLPEKTPGALSSVVCGDSMPHRPTTLGADLTFSFARFFSGWTVPPHGALMVEIARVLHFLTASTAVIPPLLLPGAALFLWAHSLCARFWLWSWQGRRGRAAAAAAPAHRTDGHSWH